MDEVIKSDERGCDVKVIRASEGTVEKKRQTERRCDKDFRVAIPYTGMIWVPR